MIVDSRVSEALRDFHYMNTPRQWARVVVTDFSVKLEWGAIHSNGDQECAIGRMTYDWINDKVVVIRSHLCG
jgi:hypothetical protein